MFSVLKISGVRLKILPEHKTGNIIRNMQGEYMTEAGNNYSEKKTQLHISVRNLVEFIFREGDIDNRSSRAMSADAMMEGTRIHRKIQGSMGKEYQAEVPLSLVVEGDLYELTVEGRADGIFTEDGKCFVDEIKVMYRKVEEDFLELAGMSEFNRRDDELGNLIGRIYNQMMGQPFPLRFLDEMEAFYDVKTVDEWENSRFMKNLLASTKNFLQGILEEYKALKDICHGPNQPLFYEPYLDEMLAFLSDFPVHHHGG